jgi:ABC-2 type transport system ATP-binding protein
MEYAIIIDNICKSFKFRARKVSVLNRCSIEVYDGEIFGFLGPNGAGKSTAIKILMGFIRADSGKVVLKGFTSGRDTFQHEIGYLPESPCFYENLTGIETLTFAARASGMSKSDAQDKALEVLDRLNLKHAGDSQIKTYSKGMKQRLGICLAVIHNPSIYILDEPMSGLDPLGRRLITEVILELRQRRKTVFFSSHILSDAERLCDRIGIINKGEMLFVGSISGITSKDETLEDAFIRLIEGHRGKKIE